MRRVFTAETLPPGYRWTQDDVLLLRAAVLQDERGARAWRELRPHFDLDSAGGDRSRLLPMAYRTLRALGIDDPDLARLRGIHRATWYRNRMEQARMGEVLQQLHD